MKKHKFLLSILSLSLFIPSTTYADCTKEEIDNFKEIEDEYKITYEFDKDTKLYTIKYINPNPEKYGYYLIQKVDLNTTKKYDLTKINDNEYEQTEILPGDYIIEIAGKSETCNEKIKTLSLKLPKYNKYSEDQLCKGIEEFVLCQPTYDKDIDYETFTSRVNSYKKNHSNIENKKEEKKEESKENRIIQYIKDNLFQIIIIAIFVIMIIITIILTVKSIKKSRRLEWE